MSALVQRTASVVLITGVSFLWQLYKDSGLPASGLDPSTEMLKVGSPEIMQVEWIFELIWPPTTKSLPFLVAVITCFILIFRDTFFRAGESVEAKRVREVKKRLLLAQMAQALRWDQDEAKDNEDEEKEDKKKDEEKKKKRPPLAKDLFEMVYDDVEERHVTDYGISATKEPYVSTKALFIERLSEDFRDAVKFTNLARQQAVEKDVIQTDEKIDGEDLKRIAEFFDGTKLQELLELYKKKIIKAFGRNIVDKKLVKSAQECERRLVEEQRRGASMLWPIIAPLLPTYLCANGLMAFDSVVGCVTYNGLNTLLDGIAAGTMTMEELKWITLQAYTKLVFCIFAHLSSCALVGKVTSQFRLRVRNKIMLNLVRQDMKFFDIFPSGILQERLNSDAEQLAGNMFQLPNQLIHHFFLTISVSYTLYNLSRPLFSTVFIPIPFISLACYFIIKCMHTMGDRQRKIGEHVAANTMEVLKEIRTVREFAMEEEEADKFAANSSYRAEIEEYASGLHHIILISPLICLFDGVRFFCTYLGGAYVASGSLTVGQAVLAGSLSNDLQHIVQGFFHILPDMVKTFQPLGRVCDILSMKPNIEPYPGQPAKLKPPEFQGALNFKDVDFTFPSEPLKQILFKVTFAIAPGEKVGFVGATGSGKSTAIKLIERFYDPQAGEITLDGKPIQAYDVHHLRRHMSVVAQDNTLFSTTIRENIIYGLPQKVRESISDEQVEEACRKANAWSFVQDFPRKLETYAGERGVKLSGGQKQRLAIARAIIRKPTIVLLDEATSALDSKAEVVVKEALDKMIEENAKGCTIIIAHRLTTVKTCDKILIMDKGSIKESGTHDKLMEMPIEKEADGKTMKSGWYHDLWETQHGKGDDNKARVQLLEQEVKSLKGQIFALKHHLSKNEITFRLGHAKRSERVMDEPPPMLSLNRAKSLEKDDHVPPQPLTLERAKTTMAW